LKSVVWERILSWKSLENQSDFCTNHCWIDYCNAVYINYIAVACVGIDWTNVLTGRKWSNI